MLMNRINVLREELNKQVINSDLHKQSLLVLSRELDRYIADYMENKCNKKKRNFKK